MSENQLFLNKTAYDIMDINHPKINNLNNRNTRKAINTFNNALYVERDKIEICMNDNISINKNIIQDVDEYDCFLNHLNTNGVVVITIYEGIEYSKNDYIHSYTNVHCNYVPSDNNYLYFNIINKIPFYNYIR